MSWAEVYFLGYIEERTKVSSRHKLPTLDELRRTSGYKMFQTEVSEAAIASLVARGSVIIDGPYYCTEKKDIL